MSCFLDAAEALVRQSIAQYQKDGREHLHVAFGCTGGQHRSVYFAERMVERLAGIDGVEVELLHAAQSCWSKMRGRIPVSLRDLQTVIFTTQSCIQRKGFDK